MFESRCFSTRRLNTLRLAVMMLLVFAAACAAKGSLSDLKDGDIIFQTSRSSQSEAIQRATRSRFSHVGLVFHRDGKPFVLEAISTVQLTPLDRWIARGKGKHFVVKRLGNADAVLTPAGIDKLRGAAMKFEGRKYDLTFDWSDERIYCSELVWKAYDRAFGIDIGTLQKVCDLDLSDPVVKAKMHERYGDAVPLDEPVISPAAVFASPELVAVVER